MTEVRPGVIIIKPEKPQQCDLCGVINELRPYGPNGECICYECGQKNPEVTQRKMNERFQMAFELMKPDRN